MNGTKTNSFQVRFISVFSGQFSRSRRYDSIIDRGSNMTRVLLKLWSHFAIRLYLDMCSLEFKQKKLQYKLYPQQGSCQKTCCVHFQKKKTMPWPCKVKFHNFHPSSCGELWQSIKLNPGSINDPILFYWKCTLTSQGNPVIWQKVAFILKYSSRFFPAASPKLMFWIGDLEF